MQDVVKGVRNTVLTGYLHPSYVESLREFGTPHYLPRSGGWLLVRPIPGTSHHDAMGPYPIFRCVDWEQLPYDLQDLGSELVSLSLVLDPFGDHTEGMRALCFPDVNLAFKEHFVIDLQQSPLRGVSEHHRRDARKGLARLSVQECERPADCLDDWVRLYEILVKRHGITGITAFSKAAFACQMGTPGLVALRALRGEVTVGMQLWYVQGQVAYYHLAAVDETGYAHSASYALVWRAIELFCTRGLRWVSLGAGAGLNDRSDGGLTWFKKGWTPTTRTAFFCGRIFDRQTYHRLSSEYGTGSLSYFPAYRRLEYA